MSKKKLLKKERNKSMTHIHNIMKNEKNPAISNTL